MKKLIVVIGFSLVSILNAGIFFNDTDIETCESRLKVKMQKLPKFLEFYYMGEIMTNEKSVLQEYKKLDKAKIFSKLKNSMDPKFIQKLLKSQNVINFHRLIIDKLKSIEVKLKKNEPDNLNGLIKEVEFLMFAWTIPMEILSTKKIYDNSLLGLTNHFYKSLDKEVFIDYNKYIYTLFDNIIVENIDTVENLSVTPEIKYAIVQYTHGMTTSSITENTQHEVIEICNLYDRIELLGGDSSWEYATVFQSIDGVFNLDTDINDKSVEFISQKEIFSPAIIFHKSSFMELDIENNPLSDEWYMMIRKYIVLQKYFYMMKKEIQKIINILEILPDSIEYASNLETKLIYSDKLYRKLDEIVRYNVFDLPVLIYSDLFSLSFKKNKGWLNDNEKGLSDSAIGYNKVCGNMQQYMVKDFTIKKVMKTTKVMRKEFDDLEWKEILTRAKLSQDWFNMLNKVSIKNK